jgi:hypothetical protein
MAVQPKYAQLPVFKYQTFDPHNLVFSEHSIIPPSPPKMRYFGEGADADDPPKNDDVPVDNPADTESSEQPVEIIDLSADASTEGRLTADPRRQFHLIRI